MTVLRVEQIFYSKSQVSFEYILREKHFDIIGDLMPGGVRREASVMMGVLD